MKKKFIEGLKVIAMLTYFLGGGFLWTYVDTQLVAGIQPSFMAKSIEAEVRGLLAGLRHHQEKSPQVKNPYDLSAINYNPEGTLLSAIGINPKCFPKKPVNTLAVFDSPKAYSNYKGNFDYKNDLVGKKKRFEIYHDFFKKLTCPKNGEIKVYGISATTKHNFAWTYAYAIDKTGEPYPVSIDGTRIYSKGRAYWFIGLLLAILLWYLNWKFLLQRGHWYLAYPNIPLIIGFIISIATGLGNQAYWTPI